MVYTQQPTPYNPDIEAETLEANEHQGHETSQGRSICSTVQKSRRGHSSRGIFGMLLLGVTDRECRKAIYDQNALQARSPKTAKRLSVSSANMVVT